MRRGWGFCHPPVEPKSSSAWPSHTDGQRHSSAEKKPNLLHRFCVYWHLLAQLVLFHEEGLQPCTGDLWLCADESQLVSDWDVLYWSVLYHPIILYTEQCWKLTEQTEQRKRFFGHQQSHLAGRQATHRLRPHTSKEARLQNHESDCLATMTIKCISSIQPCSQSLCGRTESNSHLASWQQKA